MHYLCNFVELYICQLENFSPISAIMLHTERSCQSSCNTGKLCYWPTSYSLSPLVSRPCNFEIRHICQFHYFFTDIGISEYHSVIFRMCTGALLRWSWKWLTYCHRKMNRNGYTVHPNYASNINSYSTCWILKNRVFAKDLKLEMANFKRSSRYSYLDEVSYGHGMI